MNSDEIFSPHDERMFKQQFALQFIAGWCATHYSDFCVRGLQGELENPPCEDAASLACEAWEAWRDQCGVTDNTIRGL